MRTDTERSRSLHLSTVFLWALAGVAALAGMAFDSGGSFTWSIVCFLAASAALVAPMILKRRRDASPPPTTD